MEARGGGLARRVRGRGETDRRLQEIERALGIARAPAPQPEPAAPPARVEFPPLLPAQPPPLPPPVEKPGFQTNVRPAWVNRIAVVTSALFVAFAFKCASHI